jgi:hypothetical protein
MMLAMAHPMLTGGSGTGGLALLAFVGAHAVIFLALAGLGIFAARFAPRLQKRLSRFHRPSRTHLTSMLTGAGLAAGIAHLSIHGGL